MSESNKYSSDRPKLSRQELNELANNFRTSSEVSQPFEYARDQVMSQLQKGDVMAMNNFWSNMPGAFRRTWEDYVENATEEQQKLQNDIDSTLTKLGLDTEYIGELIKERSDKTIGYDYGQDLELQLAIWPVFDNLLEQGYDQRFLIS